MLNIPETYLKNNEDYITIPAIRKFMKDHPAGAFKLSKPRESLMQSILDFGNQNNTNAEIVLDWIDAVLQEGIKDVYLQYAPIPEDVSLLLLEENSINDYLSAHAPCTCNKHICMNRYTEEYKLVSATYSTDTHGRKITFVYCRKLHVHDKKKLTTKVIDYPVVADYYPDCQWLLVRAKPRSNLYLFNPTGFKIEEAQSTTTEKEIKTVTDFVEIILRIDKTNKAENITALRHKVFGLVHKYTQTPKEIEDAIAENDEKIHTISAIIQSICSRPGQCIIPESMHKDIEDDVSNIIEKYLSINWMDKNIFIKDRDAYPIRLSATDEEESKVDQTAALEQPLQTKAIFFDNKKMLYKSKKCDGVVLCWKRHAPSGFSKDSFLVNINIAKKGQCVFKFPEYTEKEDIENVIFSIIDN